MKWAYNPYNPEAVEPPEPEYYECPICGEEIPYGSVLYYNNMGECVGCEECVTAKFVEDVYEEEEYAVRERLNDA